MLALRDLGNDIREQVGCEGGIPLESLITWFVFYLDKNIVICNSVRIQSYSMKQCGGVGTDIYM